MRYVYVIPKIPPSNNQYIGQNKRWQYQEAKKEWADTIGWLCRPKPPYPLNRAKVTLVYYFKDRRRRDPDNYSGKFILDGLVRAGILEDDSFDNVDLNLRAGVDKENPRTEIYVEEK